jgi:hypothetical protein
MYIYCSYFDHAEVRKWVLTYSVQLKYYIDTISLRCLNLSGISVLNNGLFIRKGWKSSTHCISLDYFSIHSRCYFIKKYFFLLVNIWRINYCLEQSYHRYNEMFQYYQLSNKHFLNWLMILWYLTYFKQNFAI